ncbi:RNA-guided endonuclease IscB [Clostridium sp. CM027]|uniref:RNA-guided endonuclease IscB n=1 Tax=Clostridium sp. CM027 TaxID=2849865 RepID=UPI0028692929|nr:RNA-guided endonuclease IscB [Clostridium sp. CM027]
MNLPSQEESLSERIDFMVYVLDVDGKQLMPTSNPKARQLLKQKKAIVKHVKPFTIQLTYRTKTEYIQTITLGVDSGYLNIGFSATTDTKELICGEVKLLQGMSDRITEKAMYRRIRRDKSRYRKPRWNNRKVEKEWLAPSIQHKLDSHIRFIDKLRGLLPIKKVIVEVANFDIQQIKNRNIQGEEYQQGEQMGFYNLREYILHRDNHQCQNPNCKNKDKNPILELHHISFKSNGGTDIGNNLITLCNKCHTSPNHKKGKLLDLWQTKKPKIRGFKDATFMSMVRWRLVNTMGYLHTYGYITKHNRIKHQLEKTHYNDAFCIANDSNQTRVEPILFEQVRRNNRSLEKFYDAKMIDLRTGEKVSGSELNNGRRTRNKNKNSENLRVYRGEKISKGQRRIRKGKSLYQPNDLVRYDGQIYTVKGSQNGGKYVALKEIKKVPKVELLTPYRFRKGFAC